MTKRLISLALALVVLAGAGWYAWGRRTEAPAFTLTTLDGTPLSKATLQGKVVLVNFWATTCTTCVREMPQLAALQRKFDAQRYLTVAVAMDYDNPAWVRDYSRRTGLPFAVAHDVDGAVARAFGGVRLTPTSFLIDAQGRIVQHFLGAPDFVRLEHTVDALLKSAGN